MEGIQELIRAVQGIALAGGILRAVLIFGQMATDRDSLHSLKNKLKSLLKFIAFSVCAPEIFLLSYSYFT